MGNSVQRITPWWAGPSRLDSVDPDWGPSRLDSVDPDRGPSRLDSVDPDRGPSRLNSVSPDLPAPTLDLGNGVRGGVPRTSVEDFDPSSGPWMSGSETSSKRDSGPEWWDE